MSQSLAHLFKSKIFLGNSSPTPIEDDKRKKGKRWGRKKDSDNGDKELLESPTKNQKQTSNWGTHSPMSPLNSIGEENGNKVEGGTDTGTATEPNLTEVVEIDEISEDNESGEHEAGDNDQSDVGLPSSPVKSDGTEKKPSKLHMLKSRISVPDLSFKPPMLGHHHHSSSSHNKHKSLDKSPSSLQMNSPNSASMSPGSFTTYRASNEKSANGFSSLDRLGSNSSASSSRFFCSPKKTNNNIVGSSSMSRIALNSGNNLNSNSKPRDRKSVV